MSDEPTDDAACLWALGDGPCPHPRVPDDVCIHCGHKVVWSHTTDEHDLETGLWIHGEDDDFNYVCSHSCSFVAWPAREPW